jgi:membrane protein
MVCRSEDHPMSTQTPPGGWRGLADSLLPAGKRFIQRDGPRYGAAVAFYTLFSLAPLLVVVTAGVALLLGTDEAHAAIYAYLERFFGESEAKAMKSLADAALARVSGPGIAAWIAIGTTVVGASAVFLELQAALRRLWGAEDSPGAGLRGLIIGRLTGFALALGVGFLLAVTLMAEAAMSAALAWFGEGQAWYAALAGAVDLLLVNAASAALFALLLARLAPQKGLRWRDALPAAAVTTGLFAVGRYLIALYLARTGVASAYGAAGSLAAILVWIYWSAQIFLYGACVLRVQQPPEASKLNSPAIPASEAGHAPTTTRNGEHP